MLRLYLHRGLEPWLIIQTFYNGLLYNTKLTLDAAVGSALMDKSYEDAYQLIENMAQNHYRSGGDRNFVEKWLIKCEMYEVNVIDHVNAKMTPSL